MSTYKRCEPIVAGLADQILKEFDSHKPLVDVGVRTDLVFAYADTDKDGMPLGPALKQHGVAALGICRIIPAKQRALGRGDAEISLDGDWWRDAPQAQRRALLDHEFHHLQTVPDKHGQPKFDYLKRPKLRLRKHDFQFGWFVAIAQRHGGNSQECIQARAICDVAGQLFWPEIADLKRAVREAKR